MKTKTAELIGPTLDWAVATIEGHRVSIDLPNSIGKRHIFMHAAKDNPLKQGMYQPSTDWAQGGPIIEREKVGITFHDERDEWEAPNWAAWSTQTDDRVEVMGETPLIAAMRCYVASKLGNEVDIPEELI